MSSMLASGELAVQGQHDETVSFVAIAQMFCLGPHTGENDKKLNDRLTLLAPNTKTFVACEL